MDSSTEFIRAWRARTRAPTLVGNGLRLSPTGAEPGGAKPRLPDAQEGYDEIARRLASRRPVVFLDYDGTLTPIVDRPEQAVLSDAMRAVLAELSRLAPVVIVSGRDRMDVARLVGLDNLVYAGSHGFDIAGPGGLTREHPEAQDFRPALEAAAAELERRLTDVEGALVERKRFATSVHYRLVASEEAAAVEAAVEAALARHGGLRKTGGKKVFELRPRIAWDKGRAVLWLIEALNLDRPEIVPFYIGDDETDEDAFRALEGRGIGVLVADEPRPTNATYRLADTQAVEAFLRRFLESLQAGQAR